MLACQPRKDRSSKEGSPAYLDLNKFGEPIESPEKYIISLKYVISAAITRIHCRSQIVVSMIEGCFRHSDVYQCDLVVSSPLARFSILSCRSHDNADL